MAKRIAALTAALLCSYCGSDSPDPLHQACLDVKETCQYLEACGTRWRTFLCNDDPVPPIAGQYDTACLKEQVLAMPCDKLYFCGLLMSPHTFQQAMDSCQPNERCGEGCPMFAISVDQQPLCWVKEYALQKDPPRLIPSDCY